MLNRLSALALTTALVLATPCAQGVHPFAARSFNRAAATPTISLPRADATSGLDPWGTYESTPWRNDPWKERESTWQ